MSNAIIIPLKDHMAATRGSESVLDSAISSGDDVGIADWYNAQVERGWVLVDDLIHVGHQKQISYNLRVAALNDTLTDTLKAAVAEALSMFETRLNELDVDHASFDLVFDALIAATILDDTQKTAVKALAVNRWTRVRKASEANTWPERPFKITTSHASAARSLLAVSP